MWCNSALVRGTNKKATVNTIINPILSLLWMRNVLMSGKGIRKTTRSVTMFKAALEYQKACLFMHPPSLVLSQKCWTGTHKKIEPGILQAP